MRISIRRASTLPNLKDGTENRRPEFEFYDTEAAMNTHDQKLGQVRNKFKQQKMSQKHISRFPLQQLNF
jgi:hypothetical protein